MDTIAPHLSRHFAIEALESLINEGLKAKLPVRALAALIHRDLALHGFSIQKRKGGARPRALQRFMTKFTPEPNTGCWLWLGAVNREGYGLFAPGAHGNVGAHRWAYTTFVGPIHHKGTIDHLCYQPACVNPEHLEVVSRGENASRMHHTRALARAERMALVQSGAARRFSKQQAA